MRFGLKEPIKVENFRLLTAHLKFHKICTVIEPIKVPRNYVSWHLIVMLHLKKTDLLFQKWQELGEFWSEHWKVSNICLLIGPFCAKYVTFDLKKNGRVIFHDTEDSCKIWRKTHWWFGKWHEEFGKFSPEHWEVSKLRLWWDSFVRVENAWAKNLQRSYM